jgi:hypothetical protein
VLAYRDKKVVGVFVRFFSCAASCAIAERENPLDHRERLHLQALYYMRHDEHPYCSGLSFDSCGLVLERMALSLAMDLAHTLGDKNAALR